MSKLKGMNEKSNNRKEETMKSIRMIQKNTRYGTRDYRRRPHLR